MLPGGGGTPMPKPTRSSPAALACTDMKTRGVSRSQETELDSSAPAPLVSETELICKGNKLPPPLSPPSSTMTRLDYQMIWHMALLRTLHRTGEGLGPARRTPRVTSRPRTTPAAAPGRASSTPGNGPALGLVAEWRCVPCMERRPRCKRNLTFPRMVGCGHVFGLLLQPLWPLAMM